MDMNLCVRVWHLSRVMNIILQIIDFLPVYQVCRPIVSNEYRMSVQSLTSGYYYNL